MSDAQDTQEIEVQLDTARCTGYANCVSIMPEVFDLPRGSRTAVLLKTRVSEADRDVIEEAVRNCPSRAISIKRCARGP